VRYCTKDEKVDGEKRNKGPELDKDDIARAVDKRIKELIEQGLIKGP
jgi:hypothetical protein